MSTFLKILGAVVGLLVLAVVAGVIYVSTMDFNQYKGLIAEQAKAATGRDLVINGDLNLNIGLTPSIDVKGVTFANAGWGSRPEMVKLDIFSAELSLASLLSGTIGINRVVLDGFDLLAETTAEGKGNWEFDITPEEIETKEEVSASEPGALPVINEVLIKNVHVTFKDGKTGEILTAGVESLTVNGGGIDDPLALVLKGDYNGVTYEVSGTVGAPAALMAGKPFPVQLEAKAIDATVTIGGEVKTPKEAKDIDLAISADVPDLAATLKAAAPLAAGLAEAGPVPAVPVKLAAKVADAAGGWALTDVTLNLGRSDLTGRATALLGGARPKVTALFTSTLLDLDELMPQGEGKPAPAADGKKADDGRVFPDDPLPLDGLKAADAEVTIKAAKVLINKMEIAGLDVGVKLANGKLQITPMNALAFGGTIGGAVTVDASKATPTLDVALTVKQFDYGRAAHEMAGSDLVSGKVDMDIDLKGTGPSVRALMAGLDGKTRIVGGRGRIESGAFAILTGSFLSAIPGADELFGTESAKALHCAYLNFDIAKGQAAAKTVLIETGNMAVVTTGKVDLAQEKPTLRIDPRVSDSALASLAMPIVVNGTLAAPDVGPDPEALAGGVAKTAGRIGAAVATGGLSLLAEAAVDKAADQVADKTDYCALAAAGKPLEPVETKTESAGGEAATRKEEPSTATKAVEGVGGALKGLFGN